MKDSTTHTASATERYAFLHQALETADGASDKTWQNLIQACVELDKRQEALDTLAKIQSPGMRRGIRRSLERKGWVSKDAEPEDETDLRVTEADLNPPLREKLGDSVQMLFEDRMPAVVIACTLAFPLLLGLGGLILSITDFALLHVVALAPIALLVGIVVSLGRRVLLQSIRGEDQMHKLPHLPELCREAPRLLLEFTAGSLLFLGPSILLVLLGFPWIALVPILLACYLMPMAMALLLSCDGWDALSPKKVFAAVRRTGSNYIGVAAVVTLLFAPAVTSLFLTLGEPVFLVLAVMGPLCVAPALVAARMLGLTLHYDGQALKGLFTLPERQAGGVRSDRP